MYCINFESFKRQPYQEKILQSLYIETNGLYLTIRLQEKQTKSMIFNNRHEIILRQLYKMPTWAMARSDLQCNLVCQDLTRKEQANNWASQDKTYFFNSRVHINILRLHFDIKSFFNVTFQRLGQSIRVLPM